MDSDNKKIKKYFKSYLSGKKYYNIDKEKSLEYFKLCLKISNEIKQNDKYNDIIENTESECNKYLLIENKTENEKEELNLFELIETGNYKILENYKYGSINFTIYNTEGLTPLHYAIKYGDTLFLKNVLILGGCIDQINKMGHTLLEYACLEKDPNMINFLTDHGADINKHLLFRNNKLFNIKTDTEIDILILTRFILLTESDYNSNKYLDFVYNYIDREETLYIINNNNINIYFKDFIIKLDNLLDKLDKESCETYIKIIKEELEYDIKMKIECPKNKIEVLLYNIIPFIEMNILVRFRWLISLEVKFYILKIFKNKYINNEKKKYIVNKLYNDYIKTNILPEGLVQVIISQWIYKINI